MRFRKSLFFSLFAGLVSFSTLIAATPSSAAPQIDNTTLPYDVSYPQCASMPAVAPAVSSIVGINGGTPMGQNPCLADQLVWAGGAAASFYINSANPGPTLSMFWPIGQTSPQTCDATDADSLGCAYNYGYNFAEYAFNALTTAFGSKSLSLNASATTIWIDVETMNTWSKDQAKNVQVIQGAVDNLKVAHGVGTVGIYSTTRQWNEITGGSKVFAALPFWGAGAATALTAIDLCGARIGPTGGPIQMIQFIADGYDRNLVCANAPQLKATLTAKIPNSLKQGKTVWVKAKIVSENSLPVLNTKVTLKLGKKKFSAVTGANGLAKIKVVVPKQPGMALIIVSATGGKFYLIPSFVSSTQVR